jgi:uncharacterized protein (DUF305 family)
MTSLPLRPAAALLAAAALATSAARAGAQAGPAARPVAAALPTGEARARADSARLPYTAADVRFMSAMIGHHAQAVAMSRLAPSRAGSGSVRTLAERIINAQQDEIAIMQQWLRDRRQPAPAVAPDGRVSAPAAGHAEHAEHAADHAAHTAAGHHAAGHHAAGHGAMPGMLTDAELRQLAAARGAEFDRLFLTFMIRHHRGATAMVRDLFGTYGAGQDQTVFKFATDVNVDQTTEIARMQRMLAALLFDAPAPEGAGP